MCIAQTDASDVHTGFKHETTPKFGDTLTVVMRLYDYYTQEDYYMFEEFSHWPGGCMFQAKYFIPIEEGNLKSSEQ